MHLTPTEMDRLTIFTAAELPRRRHLRRSDAGRAERPDRGRRARWRRRPRGDGEDRVPLRRRDAHSPRGRGHRSRPPRTGPGAEDVMTPGEILFGDGTIVINAGRPVAEVDVENASDHTIFVSSHFPFFEVNRRLVFDRARAWGMHLDIPAGDSVRWRPGERRRVRLVSYGGRGVVL